MNEPKFETSVAKANLLTVSCNGVVSRHLLQLIIIPLLADETIRTSR